MINKFANEMTSSLIITTYNWKDALGLSLLSALAQSKLPDEIIVADDGSTDGTEDLVKKIASTALIPVIHSWQEDKGFRAAMSRNKAIARAKGDYIIFVDGDIILGDQFIEDHLSTAFRGQFIQGSRVLLNKEKTRELIDTQSLKISLTDSGIENRKNQIRSEILSKVFTKISCKMAGIRTCNFSFWKSDAIAVNGFNEDFVGWGREDSEFAARLMSNGVKRLNLRFKAIGYHLFHNENTRDNIKENDLILENTIQNKSTWCDNGINKYI